MTKKQLMKPRFKVIADYPGSTFLAGDILIPNRLDGNVNHEWVTPPADDRRFIFGSDLSKYPHLFKPLQWWEERKPEDMPEYVVIPHSCCIQDKMFDKGAVHRLDEIPKSFDSYHYVKPVTLEEYQSYTNKK